MEHLPEEVNHLVNSLASHPPAIQAGESWFVLGGGVTNYLLFMTIAILLVLLFFLVAARKVALVPTGISNVAEAGVEFVRDSICAEIIGPKGQKYFGFVASLFFFILFNNILGLIPGFKPGTGTMGVTVALALVTFVYFTWAGIREHGGLGYAKTFMPSGVPFPINWMVAIIEVFSYFLRIFTLSVRLFANMFAGHIVLGAFSLLISVFALEGIKAIQEQLFLQGTVSMFASVIFMLLMIALYALEVFVAFIQAYVFTVLTAVYIQIATSHEH